MSYSPATKLSHSNATNKATVLTNGNVMVTLGLGAGQVMTLEDWHILADGSTIVEERAPLPAAPLPAAPLATAPLATAPLPVAAPGSKFRWTLDENNYRVAIMTAKGLLEVKSVTNGGTDFKKTLFPNEAVWRASLPLDDRGMVQISEPLAEKARADEVFQTLSDVEKVNSLVKRYKVKSFVQESCSPQDSLDAALKLIEEYRANLAKLTLQQELTGHRYKLNLGLNRAIRSYTYASSRCAKGDSEVRSLYTCRRGTSKIMATVDGMPYLLLPFKDKIAAYPDSRWQNIKLYNNFAEMGNPLITVRYRCRTVNI